MSHLARIALIAVLLLGGMAVVPVETPLHVSIVQPAAADGCVYVDPVTGNVVVNPNCVHDGP